MRKPLQKTLRHCLFYSYNVEYEPNRSCVVMGGTGTTGKYKCMLDLKKKVGSVGQGIY